LEVVVKRPIPVPEIHAGVSDRISKDYFDQSLLWSYPFQTSYLKGFVDGGNTTGYNYIVAFLIGCKSYHFDQILLAREKVRRKVRRYLNKNKGSNELVLFKL